MSLQEIQMRLNAPKDQYNSFGKYKYRTLEGILEAVKPLLKEFDYSLTISDKMIEVGGRVYVQATATLYGKDMVEIVSNTSCAREAESKKDMDEAQITGAASSYARKYCVNGLFAIDDTKDADETNTHGKKEITQDQKKTIVKNAKEASAQGKEADIVVGMFDEINAIDTPEELENWKKQNSAKIKALSESSFNEVKQCCQDRFPT